MVGLNSIQDQAVDSGLRGMRRQAVLRGGGHGCMSVHVHIRNSSDVVIKYIISVPLPGCPSNGWLAHEVIPSIRSNSKPSNIVDK